MSFFISEELKILGSLNRSVKLEHRYKERITIILTYEKIGSKRGTARSLGLNRQKVNHWLSTWTSHLFVREELAAEYKLGLSRLGEYKKELVTLFHDKPRSGCPCKFTPSEIEQIIALGNLSPPDIDLPFTHWSLSLLKQEIETRGIVPSISTSHLSVFLKYAQTTSS